MSQKQATTCLCCGLNESEIPIRLRTRMQQCGYSSLSDLAKKTGTTLEDIWMFLHPDEETRAAWKLARFVADNCNLSLDDVAQNWDSVLNWLARLSDDDVERRKADVSTVCGVLFELRRGLKELVLAATDRRRYILDLSYTGSGECLFIELMPNREGLRVLLRTAESTDTFRLLNSRTLLSLAVPSMMTWLDSWVRPWRKPSCNATNHQSEHELVRLHRAANKFYIAPELPLVVRESAGAESYDILSICEIKRVWQITVSTRYLAESSAFVSIDAQHPNEIAPKLERLLRALLRQWLRDGVPEVPEKTVLPLPALLDEESTYD